jgi:prepilin-type N-terminal cleavage/methylation domain-containing protein
VAGRTRRGLTLPELLVGLTILAILGVAMVRLMLSETRNVDRLMLQRSARAVARTSTNLLLSELRMVVPENGGVIAATPTSIELFAPYAGGLSCGNVGGAATLSLLPADSVMLAGALFSGYAWRHGTGRYAFVDTSVAIHWNASDAACVASRLTTVPGGRIVTVAPPLPAAAPPGTPVFLVQRLRYWFGPSADVPGAVALLRTRTLDAVTEELAAPVDSASRFRFFRQGADTAESIAPPVLDDLRGIEVDLVGLSARPRFGRSRPERASRRVAIFFSNASRP